MVTPILISVGAWLLISVVAGVLLGRSITVADRRDRTPPTELLARETPHPRV